MKRKVLVFLALLVCITLVLMPEFVQARTIYSNETGTHDGYDYEFWKDSGGSGSMTLTSGGTFSCQWSGINNILFRKGRKFDQTQTHQQIGNITIDFGVGYYPNGNSYLCVYGWTVDPLVEYYIVESWGNWRPPGAQSKGTITIDGDTYDIYETTRVNQPSIIGTATFQQYWSVRRNKRTEGTISVSEHFRKWESMGMRMGKMYEVALTIEGYQSSGRAEVYRNNLIIGPSGPQQPGPGGPGAPGSRSAFTNIEAEQYNQVNSSTIQIIGTANGGSGLGYIENGDYVTYSNIDFGSGANRFTALVASDVPSTNIEIRLNGPYGTLLGTLQVDPTGGWNNYTNQSTTINNVSGVHDLVLRFTGPVNIDSFVFGAGGGNGGQPGQSQLSATVEETVQWGGGATLVVTITNNGTTPVDGWTASWNFAGNTRITECWGAEYIQSGSSVVARNANYNGRIEPGGSVYFVINISYSGSYIMPTITVQ